MLNRASGPGGISWYTHRSGDVLAPAALDTVACSRCEASLHTHLAALEPLSDREIGRLLARALTIASRDDVLAGGGQPVLTSCGMLLAGITMDDGNALERHFRETLGAYAPFPALAI